MAAGKGERMNPLTLEIPKALVTIAGKSLLEWSIECLHSIGCNDIVIATGWKSHLIKKLLTTLDYPITIHHIEVSDYEKGPLQTFVAAANLAHDSISILHPVDLIISSNTASSIISRHPKDNPFAVTLAIDYSATTGSDVAIDLDEHIMAISSEYQGESRNAKSAMLLVFSSGFMSYCEDSLEGGVTNIFTVLNSVIERENSVLGFPISEKWYDIDTITDALRANRHLLELFSIQDSTSIFVPSGDTMEIGDDLSLSSDIILGSGVLLKGPCLIRKNSKIDDNCSIGPYVSISEMTHIGSNCQISDTSIFGSSVITPNSKINNVVVYQSKIYREVN